MAAVIAVGLGGLLAAPNRAVAVDQPDLSPTSVTATPASGGPGSTISVGVAIANQGTAEAPRVPYRLVLSVDGVFDASDVDLGFFLSDAIVAGATWSGVGPRTVPNVPPGNYFVIMSVDWNRTIVESNETNNVLVTPFTVTAPDLAPDPVTITPASATGGEVVSVGVSIDNGGAAAAPRVPYRLFFSQDTSIDATDLDLGFFLSDPIPSGATWSGVGPRTVPSVPPGNYFVIMSVDWNGSIFESNENNNVLATPFTVRPPNTAPTATAGGPYSAAEGGSVTLTGTASDADGDALALAWDLDFDGQFESPGGSVVFSTQAIDGPTTRTVRFRACDPFECASRDAAVTVENVAPSATFVTPSAVDEGAPTGLVLTDPTDPAGADQATLRFAFSCDGSSLGGVSHATAGPIPSASCTYVDGPVVQPVLARVLDDDGGATDYADAISVLNVAPTVTLVDPGSVNEGSAFPLAVATTTDPSGVDAAAGFEYAFDCGNGYRPFTASAATLCTAPDDPSLPVGVRARDKDGGVGEATLVVPVLNVAPTVTGLTGPSQAISGISATFAGSATDPSPVDTAAGLSWRWRIDDGPYGPFGAPGASLLSATFSACGAHTITAQVRDKDGAISAEQTISVEVHDVHFLSPIDEGMRNRVRAGRVLPVKLAVGCDGLHRLDLEPRIQLLTGDRTDHNETAADEVETYSVSSADTQGTMRVSDELYIYNLGIPTGAISGSLLTIRVRPFGDSNPSAVYALFEVR